MSTTAVPEAESRSSPVVHPYISRTPGVQGGQPCVAGSRVTVRILAECWIAGMSPDEIARSYPTLTLSEVFDALGFYLDNRAEIDEIIAAENALPTPGPNRVISGNWR
jgi:uncharacterized protein (DUF433 family)